MAPAENGGRAALVGDNDPLEEQVIGILAALDTLVEDPEVEEQRKGSKWKIRHALGPGTLFMVAALISLCLLLLIVAAYNFSGKSVPQVAHVIAIILALVSQLCVLLYFVAQIWDGLKRLWNPKKFINDPWRRSVVYEARHLNGLVKYDDDALTFVAGRLGKERDHMRARLDYWGSAKGLQTPGIHAGDTRTLSLVVFVFAYEKTTTRAGTICVSVC